MYGIPETLPIKENSALSPINVYGYTKSVIEKMLIDYGDAHQLNSLRLRYFNACGADKNLRSGEAHDPEVHLIPNILQSIGSNKVFQLFGDDYNTRDGTNIRDYIHVSDLADAHVLALKYLLNSATYGEPKNIVEVVNLGTCNG